MVWTPKHTPDRLHELCWHPTCTHITWRKRQKPLPVNLTEDQIPAPPKQLPEGTPLCVCCRKAEGNPDPSTARLILSVPSNRITAIGFGKTRKDELRALRFKWGKVAGVWVFLADGTDPLETSLKRLGEALGCATEVADTRMVPPKPRERSAEKEPQQVSVGNVQVSKSTSLPSDTRLLPRLAVIACPGPGRSFSQTEDARRASPIIASVPWPPQLQAIRAAATSALPPEVPRILVLPTVAEMAGLGFSQVNLWNLASDLAALDIGLCTAHREIDMEEQFRSIRRLPPQGVSQFPLETGRVHPSPAHSRPEPSPAPVDPTEASPLEVTRVLTLPAVPDLIQHGFTMGDLFHLAADLTPLGMSLRTADGLINLSNPMAAARSLPRGSSDPVPPTPQRPKSKGGRPATARALHDQVLQLHREGHSAIAIARTLRISDRSVRRFLPPKVDS